MATVLLTFGGSIASAIDVPLPTAPEAISPGASPEPVTNAVPAPAPVVALALGSRTLKNGSVGSDVKELQRLLRRRGYRVVVDGAYGPQTVKAVKALQRKLKLRPSGVVTASLLKRLGVRAARSGVTPAAPPVPAGDYPLAGPNAASARYLKAFPVGGKHTYSNDFGAPRSQGGHQGNDIMADRGLPIRAVADGTITKATRVETSLGGISMWMRDTAGNTYYFAHLTTITDGLEAGSAVKTGQVIGTVGNTGDARYGAPHLHFEIHPGGGSATNPYTDLLAVDPEPPTGK